MLLGDRVRGGTADGASRQSTPQGLLTLASGLGPEGGADRELSLTMTGTLANGPVESCYCCGEQRQDVALDPEELGVLLQRKLHAGIC